MYMNNETTRRATTRKKNKLDFFFHPSNKGNGSDVFKIPAALGVHVFCLCPSLGFHRRWIGIFCCTGKMGLMGPCTEGTLKNHLIFIINPSLYPYDYIYSYIP